MNGPKLKYYCNLRDMTLGELSNSLGINQATLYRKISGQTDFYRHEMLAIKNALDLSPKEFEEIFFGK